MASDLLIDDHMDHSNPRYLRRLVAASLLGLISPSLSLYAYSSNLLLMMSEQTCGNCHFSSTRPSPPASQALVLRDVTTGDVVSRYQPGKTYSVELSFNPILGNGAYRVAYHIKSLDSSGLSKGEFTTPANVFSPDGDPLGTDRIYKPTPNHVARIFSSTSLVLSQNLKLQWKAPEDEGTIQFRFARVESNNNSVNDSGDRGNAQPEIVSIEGSSLSMPPDLNSTSDEAPGGCGNIRVSRSPSTLASAILMTVMILIFGYSRRRSLSHLSVKSNAHLSS